MAETTIMLRYRDREHAAAWFTEARLEGLVPLDAGLREGDLLDAGRVSGDHLVVSKEPGAGEWIVAPLEARECS